MLIANDGSRQGVARREGGGDSGASRRWRPVLCCIHGRLLGDTAGNRGIPHHKTSDIVFMGLTYGAVGGPLECVFFRLVWYPSSGIYSTSFPAEFVRSIVTQP